MEKPDSFRIERNVFVEVLSKTSKSWSFKYSFNGEARQMGLGSFFDVTVEDARKAAGAYRMMLKAGQDPLEEKKQVKGLSIEAIKVMPTFRQLAAKYINNHQHEWRPRYLYHELGVGVGTVERVAAELKTAA